MFSFLYFNNRNLTQKGKSLFAIAKKIPTLIAIHNTTTIIAITVSFGFVI